MPLHNILASRLLLNVCIYNYLLALVVLSSITKKGRLLLNVWILVFDDQHDQIGLMCLLVFIL
jgi:hypothetical protein